MLFNHNHSGGGKAARDGARRRLHLQGAWAAFAKNGVESSLRFGRSGRSVYGAERTQTTAIGCEGGGGGENGLDKSNLPLAAAVSCEHNKMVRRGFTVRVRERASEDALLIGGSSGRSQTTDNVGKPLRLY